MEWIVESHGLCNESVEVSGDGVESMHRPIKAYVDRAGVSCPHTSGGADGIAGSQPWLTALGAVG